MNIINLNHLSLYIFFIIMFNFILKNSYIDVIYKYLLFDILLNNITGSFFNLSLYYQIINFLNSKNNMLLVILIFTLFLKNVKYKYVCVIYKYILYVFILNSNIFINLNTLFNIWCINTTNSLNINLLNGLMLIHPVVLYTFYIIVLYTFYICLLYDLDLKCFKKVCKNNTTIKYTYISVFLVILSISLGCWWAEQELSWGGWWSWDFVELLALVFFITNLANIHNNTDLIKTNLLFTVVILSIITVRFNLINSIHNFISLESQNQFMFIIISFVLLLLFLIVYTIFQNLINSIQINYLFYLLLFIFIYVYTYNITTNIFYTKYNTQLNIKHVYSISILYSCLIIYILKIHVNVYTRVVLQLQTLCFLLLHNYSLIFFLLVLLLLLFLKKKLKKSHTLHSIKYVHACIMVYIYATFQQVYIFSSEFLITLCKNIQQISIQQTYSTYVEYSNKQIKNWLDVVIDFRKNTGGVGDGILKNNYNKIMYSDFSNLQEIYSYNNQQLLQLNGFIIFICLLVLILYLFVFIKLKFRIKLF